MDFAEPNTPELKRNLKTENVEILEICAIINQVASHPWTLSLPRIFISQLSAVKRC